MRSLSNVIKGCRVAYSDVPQVLSIQPAEAAPDDGVADTVRQAEEFSENGRIQALRCFVEEQKKGLDLGFAEGQEEGLRAGRALAKGQICRAAEALAAHAAALDADFALRRARSRDAWIETAFSLAGLILGKTLDKDAPEFRTELDAFLPSAPRRAAFCVDGREYTFQTMRPELLAGLAADGGSVALRVEDAAEPADAAAETEPESISVAEQEESPLAAEPADAAAETEPESISVAEQEESPLAEEPEKVSEEVPAENETEAAPALREPEKAEPENGPEEAFFSGERMAYLRPEVRPAKTPGTLRFSDIPLLPAARLRAFFRRAQPQTLAAALCGAPEDVREAFLSACPRSRRAALSDGMRFLRPDDAGGAAAQEELRLLAVSLVQEEGDRGDV